MKIDPLSAQRLSPLRRGKRGETGTGDGFAAELEGEATAPASVGAGAAAAPVEALLALQEVPDALVGKGRAKRHGEALLDQLDRLRLGLLAGRIPRAQLERLAELAALRLERIEDPHLAEILTEIELRAAVELAKLER